MYKVDKPIDELTGYACVFCNKTCNEVYQIHISDYCIRCLNKSKKTIHDVDTLWHYMLGPISLNSVGTIIIVEESAS